MDLRVDIVKVSGNNEQILREERYQGAADFVPFPDGSAYLMRPIDTYIVTNEENRNRGLLEIPPLSKYDILKRGLLSLNKKEIAKLYMAKPGEIIKIIRKGWGRQWEHTIEKL